MRLEDKTIAELRLNYTYIKGPKPKPTRKADIINYIRKYQIKLKPGYIKNAKPKKHTNKKLIDLTMKQNQYIINKLIRENGSLSVLRHYVQLATFNKNKPETYKFFRSLVDYIKHRRNL